MNGFDWPALMRAGICGLGLRPDDFWSLTPAEFRVLLGENHQVAPLGRDRLNELVAAFPDMTKGETDG